MKKRILVFCDFYLPGFKSGGGMWTVVNLVDRFCGRYDFFIVTRNYDSKADTTPYSTVATGKWNTVGNAEVHYLAADDISAARIAGLVKEVSPDCIFLNSAFSTPAVKLLMARRGGRVSGVPVILAPCGELSAGALASKPLKKKLYLAFAKARHLYRGVHWKASSAIEADEIRAIFGHDVEVMTAPDLPPRSILPEYSSEQKPEKVAGSARFVFLSRVVPKKNIGYFIDRLMDVREGSVTIDIVGPLEDGAYWAECQRRIARLPKNVEVNIVGAVSYPEGLKRLVQSHFFVLPTLNENFGYVFIESLSAGTPLLISDQTMWTDVAEHNCGWCIPLDEPAEWVRTINHCIQIDSEGYRTMSAFAREYAVNWLAGSDLEAATAAVLERALSSADKND